MNMSIKYASSDLKVDKLPVAIDLEGHYVYVTKPDQSVKVQCSYCHGYWHTPETCYKKKRDDAERKNDEDKCTFCGVPGHYETSCMAKIMEIEQEKSGQSDLNSSGIRKDVIENGKQDAIKTLRELVDATIGNPEGGAQNDDVSEVADVNNGMQNSLVDVDASTAKPDEPATSDAIQINEANVSSTSVTATTEVTLADVTDANVSSAVTDNTEAPLGLTSDSTNSGPGGSSLTLVNPEVSSVETQSEVSSISEDESTLEIHGDENKSVVSESTIETDDSTVEDYETDSDNVSSSLSNDDTVNMVTEPSNVATGSNAVQFKNKRKASKSPQATNKKKKKKHKKRSN